jgi:hypothetical protein
MDLDIRPPVATFITGALPRELDEISNYCRNIYNTNILRLEWISSKGRSDDELVADTKLMQYLLELQSSKILYITGKVSNWKAIAEHEDILTKVLLITSYNTIFDLLMADRLEQAMSGNPGDVKTWTTSVAAKTSELYHYQEKLLSYTKWDRIIDTTFLPLGTAAYLIRRFTKEQMLAAGVSRYYKTE